MRRSPVTRNRKPFLNRSHPRPASCLPQTTFITASTSCNFSSRDLHSTIALSVNESLCTTVKHRPYPRSQDAVSFFDRMSKLTHSARVGHPTSTSLAAHCASLTTSCSSYAANLLAFSIRTLTDSTLAASAAPCHDAITR